MLKYAVTLEGKASTERGAAATPYNTLTEDKEGTARDIPTEDQEDTFGDRVDGGTGTAKEIPNGDEML